MDIALGSDHAGRRLRMDISEHLHQMGHHVYDVGPHAEGSVDYPIYAQKVAKAVAASQAERGILVCSTGVGMAMVANRLAGVRAAVCADVWTAQRARAHNDVNVLCLGEDVLGKKLALAVVDSFLETAFEQGRHARRLAQISTQISTPPPASNGVLGHVRRLDPELYQALYGELRRQEEGLELIASENFVSQAVLETVGSVLINKYAEGVVGQRYYGGCEMVDQAERLACQRAQALFQADYANVQPHSGTQANMAVYMHALKAGDTILAMDLMSGGHLTHGAPVSFSGQLYTIVSYGVRRDSEQIDYDQIEQLAQRCRPKLIIAGASAYPRVFDFKRFEAIAQQVGALLMVDMAHIAGLVAAQEHPSPVPHADFVTTTTHKTLRGPRGGVILARKVHAKALDKGVCPRIQGGPLMNIIAAKAVAFHEAMQPDFVAYQRQIRLNAKALAQGLLDRGFRLVSGGTDNHMVLVDLQPQGVTGKDAEVALDAAGIAVNKNQIPFDPQTPHISSGIRLGTPAVTTRGMKESQMEQIADMIHRVLKSMDNKAVLAGIKKEVVVLTQDFPMYRTLLVGCA